MLSKENYDKLDINYLYKKPYNESEDKYIIGGNPYHCKNWTFRVHKLDDGTAWMLDTYFNSWDSHKIQVTDYNINKFEVVFDFREVEQINNPEEYDEIDLFRVATNSRGYSCGRLDWVKKNAKVSKEKLIQKAEEEIRSAKWHLESAEKDLQQLIDGTHWKLNR